ncbi:MAG: cell division protein SepF [Firmicutes bacterium]|nr:cell division protein SepF [Bacillota bacterium]
MFQRVMNFLGLGPDEEEFDEEEGMMEEQMGEPEQDPFVNARRGTVVNLHTQKQVRVILSEPATYEDAQAIADHLKAHRSVIVNLHRSPYDQALRVVDFLSGCVYALGGNMQKLGHNIFLCAPDNVDIQGTISEYLAGETRSHLR